MASKPTCGTCGSDDPKVRAGMLPVRCINDTFHDVPAEPRGEAVERARESFHHGYTSIDDLISAEREDAVKGMHARNCGCTEPGDILSDPGWSHTEQGCIAARKEAADGK